MAQEREGENPPPRKWVRIVYRTLAAGRYAVYWLPELLILYDLIVSEEGKEAADEQLMQELINAIGPSIGVRVYRVLRLFYSMWKAYRRFAGD